MTHRYLTDEEVQDIHAAMAEKREPGSFEPGKWSVSRYNRRLGELNEPTFPAAITIRDITLRTAEQAQGVALTGPQRARLAEALVSAGLSSLEVSFGWVGSFTEHLAPFKSLGYKGELCVGGVTDEVGVKSAVDNGVNVVKVMNPAIPRATPIYVWRTSAAAWDGQDWRANHYPRNAHEQVDRMSSLIALIRAQGAAASAGINMLSYADDEYLREYCTGVIDAGADWICLYDGAGGMGPEAWRHVVRFVRAIAKTTKIAVHAHNTFGLGLANSLAAVQAGADAVEVSVNHLCSASGQADLAEMVASLEVLYGVKTGVDLGALTGLRRLVEDLTGVRMSNLKPITGEHCWAYNSEPVVQEQSVEPLLHYSVMPEVFGNKKQFLIGKSSGNWSMLDKLNDLGYDMPRDLIPQMLATVKQEIELRRRMLSDDELLALAKAITAQQKPTSEPR